MKQSKFLLMTRLAKTEMMSIEARNTCLLNQQTRDKIKIDRKLKASSLGIDREEQGTLLINVTGTSVMSERLRQKCNALSIL